MMEVLAQGVEKLGLSLTPAQFQQFETYYHQLEEWNRKVNLTAITSYEDVQAKHFVDSLSIVPFLRELFPSEQTLLRAADVGAGAGMPGLPLRIALPNIHLVLIESVGKKAAFLRHIVQELELDNADVIVGRAEDLAHGADLRESFDLCMARGVAPLPTLAELTLPFVKVGGFVIAHKGAEIDQELRSSSKALRTLGGRLLEVRRVELDRILSQRNLVIIKKERHTPAAYPRRAGLPSKRPL